MNLGELTAAARELLDDKEKPYLWPDADITRRANNAVREACIRARLLRHDADTDPTRCALAVTAAAGPMVAFDPSILALRSVSVADATHPLQLAGSHDMDRYEPGWDTTAGQSGEPSHAVMDLGQKTLRLWPTPTQDIALRLRVWRVPVASEQMVAPGDEPAIVLPDPEELVHWICYECYLVKDADNFDPDAGARHLAQFRGRFGKRPTLHDMSRWADTPPRRREGHFF